MDPEGEDEGGDDEDAASVASSQPSQLPTSFQAGPSQPYARRCPRPGASGSGCNIDEAIVKLAEKLTQNTGVQDWLQSVVQESAKPCITFCQWMGAEMSSLDENLWSLFQWEAFDFVTRYRDLQTQQLHILLVILWLCSYHLCHHRNSCSSNFIPGAYLRRDHSPPPPLLAAHTSSLAAWHR